MDSNKTNIRSFGFKSYRHDPLARLIIDRLGLTPLRFALVMLGVTALLYLLTAVLINSFYTRSELIEFLVWARRSWAQIASLFVPPTLLGFYCWINSATGQLYDGLDSDKAVTSNEKQLYDLVLGHKESIQAAYNKRAWPLASILFMILLVVLSVTRPSFGHGENITGNQLLLFEFVLLPLNALLYYTIGIMAIKVIITISSLRKLFSQSTLNFRPFHPDGCGGLHRVLDFAMTVNTGLP